VSLFNEVNKALGPYKALKERLVFFNILHIVLFNVIDRIPSKITLSAWDKLTLEESISLDPINQNNEQEETSELKKERIYRSELLMLMRNPMNLASLKEQLDTVRDCLKIIADLRAFLDGKLQLDSPNLNKLITTLLNFERALIVITSDPSKSYRSTTSIENMNSNDFLPTSIEGDNLQANFFNTQSEIQPGYWRTREEAYATLEAVANYLQIREPHSPTPYLIKKAVRWGRLALPELMQEIMKEEGDLNRMSNLFSNQ
jgi:type VI secretion system protein ImpA